MTKQRKTTFDEAADLYDEVRPGYPEAIFASLLTRAQLPAGGRVLEVGCGTGQATRPLAVRGFRVQALELGPSLAAVARRNFAPYPNVTVETTAFEAWPPEHAAFDLFLSAQAFHWIEPTFGLTRAAEVLKPGGTVALLWHLDCSRETPFHRRTDPLYRRYFPVRPSGLSTHDAVAVYREGLEQSPHFTTVTEERLDWERRYEAEDYLKLLSTFSDHRQLTDTTRQRFFEEVAEVIAAFGGVVSRLYTTVLLVATRL